MRLYIGNIALSVTEADLTILFEPFGKINEVFIVRDKFKNVSKGYGFIDMPSDDEARKAISDLTGKALQGRSLDVTEARPKTDRQRTGGFGSGRSNNGYGARGGRSSGAGRRGR